MNVFTKFAVHDEAVSMPALQPPAATLHTGPAPRHRDDARPEEHVVVVGGGFGGLAAARELGRARRRGAPLRVTLVDRRNHHTFQPLLYQVATAGLQPQDIGVPLRAVLRRQGVDVRLGEVVGIDADRRRLRLADGGVLAYDRVVLAAGAVTADLGVPGVAEHALGMKSLADATTLRNHLLRRFEAASSDPEHADGGGLTFVVAGGGPTGVELAGALAELVDGVIRHDHPEFDVDRVRVVLVELQDRLLHGFVPRAGRIARLGLTQRGVEVRLETSIARVGATEVELAHGGEVEVLPTHTVVWAAGVGAAPLARRLGVVLGPGGRLPVDGQLRVQGLADVYAIGDIAAGHDEEGRLLPQVAPVAIQQGRHVGRAVAADISGRRRPGAFRYRHKGSMATIGRAQAVVELPRGGAVGGVVAWVAWLLLHLLQLVGFKRRAGVLASWLWNYATYDHAARTLLDQREATVGSDGDPAPGSLVERPLPGHSTAPRGHPTP